MGLKVYSPRSHASRGMVGFDFSEITKTTPEKSLTAPLRKKSACNNHGQITMRHVGGAHKLRGTFNCKVIAHQLDAQYIETGDQYVTAANWYGSFLTPCPIDIKINEKEKLLDVGKLKLTMYHIPGHSPGSVALTVESEGKLVLFGQDVHGPLNDVLKSNRDDYIQSLEFLLSLDSDILCEGHFGVYFGKEEVKNFIESFL